MAWGRGAATGLDDLCQRLSANDQRLTSLTILKHRKFDAVEVQKLCTSLASNTVLKELYASSHAVSPDAAVSLSDMLSKNRTLTALCIGDGSFGDAGISALKAGLMNSTSLSVLDLESKGLTAAGMEVVADVLEHSTSLQRLCLARNAICNDGAATLARPSWVALQHLDLRCCDLGAAGVASLAGQQGPCSLVSLDLSGNILGAESGSALRQLLQQWSSLKELKLRACQLADGVVELAQGLASHGALTQLDLTDNQCGEAGGEALATALGSNSSLRQLDLGSNPHLTAAAVGRLAAMISSKGADATLLCLDIAGAKLQGEAGLAVLSTFASSQLQHLCLLGTHLGNEGAQRLGECLTDDGFESLQELSISACGMDWEGGLGPILATLQGGKAPRLKVLECGANPACQGDSMMPHVLSLREARPELHVHWSASDEAAQVEVEASQGPQTP